MTRSIPLSQGAEAIVDDRDYEWLSRYNWCLAAGGYAVHSQHVRLGKGRYTSRSTLMHRMILNPPTGTQVDHQNGNRLDNRRCNLRLTDAAGNQRNKGKVGNCSSDYKGVTWARDQGKWSAVITFNYCRHALGYFADERLAGLAYDRAARRFFGEYAWLNFPDVFDYSEVPAHAVENKSGYRGVSWHRGNEMWHARIGHERRTVSLGYFHNPAAAAQAYDAAARKFRGSRARPNFPEEGEWR